MTLRPYPEYRDSGLPWLGEIPAHWEMRRNGRLFTQRNETGFPELPVLEVSLRTGVRVRDMENVARKQVMSDFTKYKRAAQGDVAYNMMRMWQGAVGIAPVDGLISPAYVVAKPRPEIDSRYFAYLFRVGAYMREVNKFSHGIVADRNRLYWEDFKQMPSTFPPHEEQEKIVAYLSARDRQIARLIRAKQRLIELLTEQKQAIIHRAVTRGLDPDAKMKQTGLDWLSEVPEGWEVKKLRHLVKLNPSKSETVQSSVHANGIIFLPMERVSEDGKIDCSERRKLGEVWNGFSYFRRDDVIVAKITPCFENGKGAHLGLLESEFGFGSTEFIVLRAGSRISAEYLYQITASPMFRKLGEQAMTGAAGQQRITNDFVKNFSVALPPTEEQKEILSFIASETKTIDRAIERARREIDLIGEYRTRLVSDVVTGRLDVRDTEPPKVEDIEDPPGLEEPLPPMLNDLVEGSRTEP